MVLTAFIGEEREDMLNVEMYPDPIPVNELPKKHTASHSKYAAMYDKMIPGQWYRVAVTTEGHKKLMSKNIAFRKLGAKCSIRTEGDEAFLFVMKEA